MTNGNINIPLLRLIQIFADLNLSSVRLKLLTSHDHFDITLHGKSFCFLSTYSFPLYYKLFFNHFKHKILWLDTKYNHRTPNKITQHGFTDATEKSNQYESTFYTLHIKQQNLDKDHNEPLLHHGLGH